MCQSTIYLQSTVGICTKACPPAISFLLGPGGSFRSCCADSCRRKFSPSGQLVSSWPLIRIRPKSSEYANPYGTFTLNMHERLKSCYSFTKESLRLPALAELGKA